MTFWVVQGLGIVTLVLFVSSLQMKTKERLLIVLIFALIFQLAQYYLTNAVAGIAATVVGLIRVIVFYLYKKHDLKPSVVALSALIILSIVLIVYTWENLLSALMFLGMISTIYGQWQDNMKRLRICAIITALCYVIYQYYAGMYTAMLGEAATVISSIVALWRFRSKTTIK